MKNKTRKEKIFIRLQNIWFGIKHFPWLHLIIVIIALIIISGVFALFASNCFKTINTISILTNLLTINGVFSAILITYLFSRITWSKERKIETLKEAICLSQKLTDFRRILNKLTHYYQVWINEKATKSLIDHGEFKHIDFYDYRLSMTSENETDHKKIIDQFYHHIDFKEAHSTLYLAMVSLVRNRKNHKYEYQEELYKDFEHNNLYNIKAVEKWINIGIFDTIYFWLNKNYDYINYNALAKDKDYILSAASRINIKYKI